MKLITLLMKSPDIEGGGARLARLGEGSRTAPRSVLLPVQGNEQIGKIDPAGDHADGRHHNVVDQRLDDGGEGGADDDANRHVYHIAAEREFLELSEHRFLLVLTVEASGLLVATFSRNLVSLAAPSRAGVAPRLPVKQPLSRCARF
jgi:hypothetical protein